MKKQQIVNILLSVFILSLWGCATTNPAGSVGERTSSDKPGWWIDKESKKKTKQAYYGYGQGKADNPTMARKLAMTRARDEVANAIGRQVQNLVEDFMDTAGNDFASSISKQVTNETLNGCIVDKEHEANDGTVYIRMIYLKDDAKKSAKEAVRKQEDQYKEYKMEKKLEDLQKAIDNME